MFYYGNAENNHSIPSCRSSGKAAGSLLGPCQGLCAQHSFPGKLRCGSSSCDNICTWQNPGCPRGGCCFPDSQIPIFGTSGRAWCMFGATARAATCEEFCATNVPNTREKEEEELSFCVCVVERTGKRRWRKRILFQPSFLSFFIPSFIPKLFLSSENGFICPEVEVLRSLWDPKDISHGKSLQVTPAGEGHLNPSPPNLQELNLH